MSTYIIFYGKPSSLIFYCYDYNGKVTELNSLLRDSYILESELFYEDNRNNKDIFSKYLFEDSKGNKYSLLKLFSKIKQISGTRISEFGVAILSDSDLVICNNNYNLLEKLKITFANHSVTNDQFNTNDFSNITDAIWKFVHDNELFNEIITKERSSSATSSKYAVILNTNDDLYDKNAINSNTYNKTYFVKDKDFFTQLRSKSEFTHDCYIQEGHNFVPIKYEKNNHQFNKSSKLNEKTLNNITSNSLSNSSRPHKSSNKHNSKTNIHKLIDFLRNISLHYYVHSILALIILILFFRLDNCKVSPPQVIYSKDSIIHSFSDTTNGTPIPLKNGDTLIKRKYFDTTIRLTITRNGNNEEIKRTMLKLDSNETSETKKKYIQISQIGTQKIKKATQPNQGATQPNQGATQPNQGATQPNQEPKVEETQKPKSSPNQGATQPNQEPKVEETQKPKSSPNQGATQPNQEPKVEETQKPKSSPNQGATQPNQGATPIL